MLETTGGVGTEVVVYNHMYWVQGWGQIHEYLYLNTFLEYLYLYLYFQI